MRSRAGLADLEDPIEIAATWGDLFLTGNVDELDWLTMRTCTIDLSGTASEVDVLGREGLTAYSRALDRAFDRVAWRVGRVEQREHEVRLDASLEAHHTGPLDLSFRGGPTFPATGRRVRLPLQRFAWTIAHKRVMAFEVERGPGLGMDLLARELELNWPRVEARKTPAEPEPKSEPERESPSDQPLPRASEASSNGEHGSRSPGGGPGGKPRIEDLIERAEASRSQDDEGGPRGP